MNLRFGCLGIGIPLIVLYSAIGSIQFSARDSARVARYPRPEILTYEEFVHRKPQEGWFRITGGYIDLAGAGATKVSVIGDAKTFGSPILVSAPLRSVKNPKQTPSILIQTLNPEICAAWSQLEDVQKGFGTDDAATGNTSGDMLTLEQEEAQEAARVTTFIEQHPEKAFLKRDVEGIVWGEEQPYAAFSRGKVPPEMGSDFIIFEEGVTAASYKRHDATTGIIGVVCVVLLWSFLIVRRIRQGDESEGHPLGKYMDKEVDSP